MEISPESDSLMNYVVTYFTPLVSFDMNYINSVIMNFFLFLLIGLMYIGSSATYLNPVLSVLSFRIFGVSSFSKNYSKEISIDFYYKLIEKLKNMHVI